MLLVWNLNERIWEEKGWKLEQWLLYHADFVTDTSKLTVCVHNLFWGRIRSEEKRNEWPERASWRSLILGKFWWLFDELVNRFSILTCLNLVINRTLFSQSSFLYIESTSKINSVLTFHLPVDLHPTRALHLVQNQLFEGCETKDVSVFTFRG